MQQNPVKASKSGLHPTVARVGARYGRERSYRASWRFGLIHTDRSECGVDRCAANHHKAVEVVAAVVAVAVEVVVVEVAAVVVVEDGEGGLVKLRGPVEAVVDERGAE